MRAPLIGITVDTADARWNVWSQRAAVVAMTYVDAVERAGGIPVLLPPVRTGAPEVTASISALVVTGGSDVAPSEYGARRHPATQPSVPQRDRWESALIRRALVMDLPVLAICRGMQLLNVVRGGTLHQHLPDVVGTLDHAPGPGTVGRHDVRARPESTIAGVCGPQFAIATYHHQAIDRLGVGVEAVAWAADGTVEGIEMPAHRFVVGIQGHPETDEDPPLFRALVEAVPCGSRAAG